jgi:hypothetical protein
MPARSASAEPDADAISALARTHTRAAVAALVAALDSSGERVQAAAELLAVAYGRPVMPLALDGRDLRIKVHGLGAPHRPNGENKPSGWDQFRERDG